MGFMEGEEQDMRNAAILRLWGRSESRAGKAGLTREDTDWSREKAVCDPPEDAIPEDGHLVEHGGVRHQEVSSVSQDG